MMISSHLTVPAVMAGKLYGLLYSYSLSHSFLTKPCGVPQCYCVFHIGNNIGSNNEYRKSWSFTRP